MRLKLTRHLIVNRKLQYLPQVKLKLKEVCTVQLRRVEMLTSLVVGEIKTRTRKIAEC